MNITVYLASSEGNSPFQRTPRGRLPMDRRKRQRPFYGGSKCGLMGELAESVLTHGGEVTGVEPQFFHRRGL